MFMSVISINLYTIMGLMIRNGIFSRQITCFISISSVANLKRASVGEAEEGRRVTVGVKGEGDMGGKESPEGGKG